MWSCLQGPIGSPGSVQGQEGPQWPLWKITLAEQSSVSPLWRRDLLVPDVWEHGARREVCRKGFLQRDGSEGRDTPPPLQSYDCTIIDSNLANAKVRVPMATVISTTIHALYTYHTHLASKRNILHDTFNKEKKKKKILQLWNAAKLKIARETLIFALLDLFNFNCKTLWLH